MKAVVDRDKCIGCGLCPDICAAVFSLDAGGFAEAISGQVPPDAEDACREAMEKCPVEAITLVEAV
jgi:ferredoxin